MLFISQDKEAKVHFFLETDNPEAALLGEKLDERRLSKSADELEKADLPTLQDQYALKRKRNSHSEGDSGEAEPILAPLLPKVAPAPKRVTNLKP